MAEPRITPLPERLWSLLEAPVESRAVEYKGPGTFGDLQVGIVKTALAMSNLDQGGYIVVGVEETPPGQWTAVGLSPSQLRTFVPDDINDQIRRYADPPFGVAVDRGEFQGQLFVVITTPPFAELPTICRRDGGPSSELRAGAIYTRSIHRPETTEVRSQDEMRQIVERAVDIGIAKMRTRVLGMVTPDAERFREERGGFD